MVVKLPENNLINKATLSPITKGFHRGHYAIHLILSSTTTHVLEKGIDLEILSILTKLKLPKYRLLRISGPLQRDEYDLMTLLRSLRAWDFHVQMLIRPEELSHPVVELAEWRILLTSSPDILLPCQEIWYAPDTEMHDIMLPPHSDIIFLYLDSSALRLSDEDTLDFLSRSSWKWAIL